MRTKSMAFCFILALYTLNLRAQETFSNPLLPSGADPWCIYKDGYYYYTNTTGNNITLWKTKNIAALATAEKKVVFTPPPHTAYSRELWAPELHLLQGKWYIYFAADSGQNKDHRLWVLENSSADPLRGNWKMKGKLTTPEDKWSIDGTVCLHRGQLYLFWSGWEGDENGQQNIYVAKMKNPWTITGKRVKISSPELEWEKHGDLGQESDVPHVNVNEGPQLLKRNGKLFLIYSASGCWTDHYSLGMLTASANSNIMDVASWKKSPEPVFTQSLENGVYAPGHNSFFQSPDGKEDWILYHANNKPGLGCGKARSPRAQRFSWKEDGTPDFGTPVKESEVLAIPGQRQASAARAGANHTSSQPDKSVAKSRYTNPLFVAFGDPYVLYVKGDKYYMYGTGGDAVHGFAACSSTDLVNWKNEGQVYFGNNKNGWGDSTAKWNGAYWAPEVYERNGKFYLFYSAQWKENPTNEVENFRIGVAVSDKPTGPFIDISNKPLFDPGYPVIDANVHFDDDGRIYLYYSRCCYKHPVKSEIADWAKSKGWYDEIEESWIYGVELKPDFSGIIGEPVLLLRPPVSMKDKQAEWESRSVTSREVNRRWTEGSVTFKKGDTYYMMYSANFFGGKNYAVGYATSKSPLGPFVKAANNPVLEKNTGKGGIVTGTGHNSIAYSPDGKEMFCVYHGRTAATGDQRVVFIDRMKILENGKLVVLGPDTNPQPVPSGVGE